MPAHMETTPTPCARPRIDAPLGFHACYSQHAAVKLRRLISLDAARTKGYPVCSDESGIWSLPSAPSHRSRLTLPPFFNPLARLLGAHHPQITACSLALLAAIDLNLTYYYSTATISPAPTSYRMHATPMPCSKDYSEAVTGFDRFSWSSTSIYRLDSRNHAWVALEHLHPWAERQLSKWALKGGLQACTEFFFTVALPHRYLHIGSSSWIILAKLS